MNKCIIINFDNAPMVVRSLGSHRIATLLRQNDWDVEVVDFGGYWTLEEFQQLMLQRVNENFKFIGISGVFLNTDNTPLDRFVRWCKSKYPQIKIILGAPQRYMFDNKNIDYNINGFGENAILVLLKYLFSNGPPPAFTMNLNSGKNISENEYYPAYPLKSLMVKYEDRDFILPDEWLGVETSRGCAFSCSFCNFPVLGVKGDYTRDAEDFRIQMVDAYDRFGVSHYYISDETFNDRTEKITKFADVVQSLPFDTYFSGFIRADLLISRKQDREELLRMNFLGQFYGIETFNHAAGKAVGKGMNTDKLKQGLIDVKNYFKGYKQHHYRGYISLIAGLPHETVSSLYETRDWLWNNWQGQGFSMFQLEIPVSEYLTSSKISKDWAKYGYTNAEADISMSNDRLMVSHDNLIWKNEHMTIKDAESISKEIEGIRDIGDFYIDNFSLARTGAGTLEDRLKLRSYTPSIPPMGFINNYISKKLGL
jgi:radical SAM superfamily enzyme YgiQ (UPF0313 family)